MSYNALVAQVLLSSPSDLSEVHRDLILNQVKSWNASHGRIYGINFNLVDWRSNAAAASGEYPQKILNEQIVDESDAALVVFTDRMGTPTPSHPSGTAEEIHQLQLRGKDIAVLKDDSERPEPVDPEDLTQKEQLETYVKSLYKKALVKSFKSDEELRDEVALVLSFLARKHRREADTGLHEETESSDKKPEIASESTERKYEVAAEGVWPRLEVSEYIAPGSRGRPKIKRRWRVVLENNSQEPVNEVRVRFEDGEGNETSEFDLGRTSGEFAQILAPGGKVERPLLQSWQSPPEALCVVSWKDGEGVAHETRASLRTR